MQIFERDKHGRSLVPMHLTVRKAIGPGESTDIVMGAPNEVWSDRRLRDMKEAEVASLVLDTPSATQVIHEMTGLMPSRMWCLLQTPRVRLLPSSPSGVPGDFDAICGEVRDGVVDLSRLVSVEFKLAKAKQSGDDIKYASGWGQRQAHEASLLGFDQAVLIHFLVRDPQARSGQQAPWADAADASTFRGEMERMAGRLAKDELGHGDAPYGVALVGLGHAEGVDPADSMALTPVPLSVPSFRPFWYREATRAARREIERSLRTLLQERMPASRFFGFCVRCGSLVAGADVASVARCRSHR
jgi:hypothetical protein